MSVFICEKCFHVENSATSNFWDKFLSGEHPLLCCQCEFGKHHGKFPRKLITKKIADEHPGEYKNLTPELYAQLPDT